MKHPIKVVYIMGVFRSGSTVFDTFLGNLPDFVSAGELVNVYQHAWEEGLYCACGAPGNECLFWTHVRRKWEVAVGHLDLERTIKTQHYLERFVRWPLLLLQRLRKSKRFREYERDVRALYEAVREESGSAIVVDSSKNPGRGLALSMVDGIELSVIHLVRDGRGVAWSCLKSFEVEREKGLQVRLRPVPAWRTTIRWVAINLSASIICRLFTRRSLRIRYEDFVDHPGRVLDQVAEFLDADVTALKASIAAGKPLTTRHTIAGNRVRMNREIALEHDAEWRTGLSWRDRAVFWSLAGGLARIYGYERDS
jgi:hypothetical protein